MASQNVNFINSVGHIVDPTTVSSQDGAPTVRLREGRQAEQCVDDLHGKHFTAGYRNRVFEANVVNVTVPVIAASLASVFTLYNPPGSGVNAEMIDTTLTQWMVAAVVDTVGWYYSPAQLTQKGTFSTLGTTNDGAVGASPPNKVQFYSSYAHSGTPLLCDVIGSYGATSNVSAGEVTKFYDGRLILPPGVAMSIAMSTTVGTTTGLNIEARWCEWPV